MLHELYVLAAAVNLSSTVNGASFRRFLTNGSFPKAVGDVRTMGPLLQQAQSAIYSWLPELPAQPGHDPQSVVPAVLRLMTALQEVTKPSEALADFERRRTGRFMAREDARGGRDC
jgi:hypothetical protein